MLDTDIFSDVESIGVMIFSGEKILYVNKGFTKITGYTKEDVEGISLSYIFTYDMILKFKSKELFSDKYSFIKKKTGDNIFVKIDYNVIKNNSDVLDCIIFIDKTKELYVRSFYRICVKMIDFIFTIKDIKKFFEKLCYDIIYETNFKLVLIGKINNKDYVPIAYRCKDKNSEYVFKNNIKNNTLIEKQVLDGEILLKEKGEQDIYSLCSIPLIYENKHKYILNIYSDSFGLFQRQDILSVLKDMQRVIIYFLKYIDEISFKDILFNGIENTYDWVVITNKDGVIEYANKAVEIISGYKREELLGKTPAVFSSGLYDREFYKNMWDTILSGKVYKNRIINKKKDGSFFEVYHTIIPIYEDEKISKFISIAKDITREILLERQIERMRYYDFLTGLYNREGFIKRILQELVKGGKQDGKINTIFVLDIVDFSKLNEIYGIELCDKLLITISKTLKLSLPPDIVLGRLVGDKFVVFFRAKKREEIFLLLENMLDIFERPIKDDKLGEVSIEVKIGVKSFVYNTLLDIEEELARAEVALNIAKKEEKTNFKFYDENLQHHIRSYISTSKLIYNALKNNWFFFLLQPIYRVSSLEIVGAETLVRINHPERGVIPPIEFVEILENSSFLREFEENLFDTAIEYLKKIKIVCCEDLTLSVNVSINSFKTRQIIDILNRVPPDFTNFINIEITERVFAENLDMIFDILNHIQRQGFKIEIDDFGTGYSSLSYIDKLPITCVKIDKSFVEKLTSSKKTRHIVRSVIDICKVSDFLTIAEGVETKEQFDLLKEFGCDMVQGYYFSKPMKLEDLLILLKKNKGTR